MTTPIRLTHLLWTALLIFVLAACTLPAPQTPTQSPDEPITSETPVATDEPSAPTGETITGIAIVDSIELLIAESFPVQVFATVRGSLPDGCTTLDQIIPTREGKTFTVSITTIRPADQVCTEALVPFEENFPLDVNGLPAGTYTVVVNTTTTAEFELAVDNVLTEEPTLTPADNAAINGLVWHDLCSIAGGEGGEPAVPSEGCVEIGDPKTHQANGTLDANEPGLAGVTVSLAQGACPDTTFPTGTIATATTGTDGKFSFTSLPDGEYCVFVDLGGANESLMLPGWWTFPVPDSGKNSVQVGAGETVSNVNFGWDYQFLPAPEQAACTDKATFVADVTVPDNTSFPTNHSFVKTWRLKNDGTCTWDSSYALVFDNGDQMAGNSPASLPKVVAPGESVDISVTLTTPISGGTYRGEWLLQNSQGKKFGLGSDADGPFFVQIIVTELASDLNLGPADWTDSFDNASQWFLLKTANTEWTIEDGHLEMKATAPGGEEWGLSRQPELADFYLEASFRTGDKCSGLDRYGILFRSPDPNMGYVLGISCDGRYRLYIWDGQTYNPLQDWKNDANILTGPDKTNKIGVWAKGNELSIYINGVKVAEFNNGKYDEGDFGLLVGSSDTSNFSVFVEEIAYWELED
ncbi:MAG TPA: NBR1-Ig-like domain-containing protein [Anaerolineales bacterium]|nr:NBR1-Ig-like domain-containing protein [Anaerolineales bacterium]